MAENIIKCEHDSPNRCQAVITQGQCPNQAEPGQIYCAIHGGRTARLVGDLTTKTRNYNLGKWQARVERFSDSPELKSLAEEIGVLRMLLEQRLNACQSNTDLMLQSQGINTLILNIERLVTSCHKLEQNLGTLLNKADVIQFATEMISVITEYVTDQDILAQIGDRLQEILIGREKKD